MVDWGAGNYERTAVEYEPVAQAVVDQAALSPGERVVDLGCGTGNAALLAAARGARVVAIDAAPRLLDVARERARSRGSEIEFREGDLLDLPVDDGSADVMISVFGLIFATDPSRGIGELGRVVRGGGRAYVSAWIPEGPIDGMLAAVGCVVGRITQAPAPTRFAWSDPTAVGALAAAAGLSLVGTTTAELAIRDSSPEAYVEGGRDHPMALSVRPVLEQAGADAEATAAMVAVLREANEDPHGFLVHRPYVVHEMRAG
jgi:SAM-dependent methyltransferase